MIYKIEDFSAKWWYKEIKYFSKQTLRLAKNTAKNLDRKIGMIKDGLHCVIIFFSWRKT